MRIVVITGLSGAGKSTALHALEDIGYFVVDNLPPILWASLIEQVQDNVEQLAIAVDIRTRGFLDQFEQNLSLIKELQFQFDLVYLDASDDVLVKRYNFTRRTHPLGTSPLIAEIAQERETLGPLRAEADIVLDTSKWTARNLTDYLQEQFSDRPRFRLQLLSFGFKRGIPIGADNVLDVRGLPNPYYDLSLRPLDGRDEPVQRYVFTPEGLQVYDSLKKLTTMLSALAKKRGRSTYTVAIGCTGGQHRSVAIAERLGQDLAAEFVTSVEHRDVEQSLKEHT